MPSIDANIRHYVDSFGEAASIALLKALADPTAGGEGYKVTFKSIIDADGWEVHQASRLIVLDTTNWSFENDTKALAKNLREAVETEIFRIRTALLPRLGWGTGKVLLGVVETSVGLIGVVVPEPGTTAAWCCGHLSRCQYRRRRLLPTRRRQSRGRLQHLGGGFGQRRL